MGLNNKQSSNHKNEDTKKPDYCQASLFLNLSLHLRLNIVLQTNQLD